MNNNMQGLTSNQLLCNRHYVDYIDSLGRSRFEDWNIDAYLCGKLGSGEYRPDLNINTIAYTEIDGLILNDSDGIHYGYELFLRPCETWPLRGAPFFWCEMARELTDEALPLLYVRIDEVAHKLKIKHNIPDTGGEWIFVPEYSVGVYSGMSSGAINADGVNTMINEIKQRNMLYEKSPNLFVKKYVKCFEQFPYLYD